MTNKTTNLIILHVHTSTLDRISYWDDLVRLPDDVVAEFAALDEVEVVSYNGEDDKWNKAEHTFVLTSRIELNIL